MTTRVDSEWRFVQRRHLMIGLDYKVWTIGFDVSMGFTLFLGPLYIYWRS